MGQLTKKETSPIVKWTKHFSSDTAIQRVPNSSITFEAGQSEKKLFQLQKDNDEPLLVKLVAEAVKSLVSFLNVSKNMDASQIYDTSELILSEFNDMSIMSIQDCFKMVKLSKKPFDKKLYEKIDGRKILEMLQMYREYECEMREESHKNRIVQNDVSFSNVINEDMMIDFKKRKVNNILNEPVKMIKSEERDMVQGWLKEYDQLRIKGEIPDFIVSADQYLKMKLKEYNKERTGKDKPSSKKKLKPSK